VGESQKIPQRATLRDVALAANVAVSTVSGILNQRTDSWASQATKKRVSEAARKLSYTPNRLARGLRLRQFMRVTLVIPDLMNPLYAVLARALQRVLSSQGYELLVEETENESQKEAHVLQELEEQHSDGIVCVLENPLMHRPLLERLCRRMAVVVFASPLPETEIDTVESDFHGSFREVIQHVVKLGHSRAGFVDALAGHTDPIGRLPVFRGLANEMGLECPETSWIRCSAALDDIRVSVRTWAKLITPAERASVLFCTNDLAAICAIRGLLDAGLVVPDDVSVVGFDDIPISAMLPCPLTTIYQPVGEMARKASEAIIRRIKNRGKGGGTATHVSLPTRLVLRESAARPKGRKG